MFVHILSVCLMYGIVSAEVYNETTSWPSVNKLCQENMVHLYIHTNIHVYVYIYVYIYMYICKYRLHVCVYVCIHIHTYTHTHTHTRAHIYIQLMLIVVCTYQTSCTGPHVLLKYPHTILATTIKYSLTKGQKNPGMSALCLSDQHEYLYCCARASRSKTKRSWRA